MKSEKLSIIIPVYNGADCVAHCLDSVYALPLSADELEIIVVDDCSTDNTLQVLSDYAFPHPNLHILHQEHNLRQGAARNRGMEVAQGEYIAFVDADDEIVVEGFMNALAAVAKSKADICYFDFEYQDDNGEFHIFPMPKETHNTIMSAKQYLNEFYTCWFNGPVRNLYRTDFLKATGIRFVEGLRCEDCDWTVKVYAQADKIQFVDGVGYRYLCNPQSTRGDISAKTMTERILAGCRLLTFAQQTSLLGLSYTITEEARYRYIENVLRLRNLTKYSVKDICLMNKQIGTANWQILNNYTWSSWVQFYIQHRILSIVFLFVACPMAAVGRKIIASLRHITK